MNDEQGTPFYAADAEQRRHLLYFLSVALDHPDSVGRVAQRSFEGEETSLFLWSFYVVGQWSGLRFGRREGLDSAFDSVYGAKPKHAVARARARSARRRGARSAR